MVALITEKKRSHYWGYTLNVYNWRVIIKKVGKRVN